MRYIFIMLLTFGINTGPASSKEIFCKDRDLNTAISGFDDKAAAESWFTL